MEQGAFPIYVTNRTWSRVNDMIDEAVELAEIELRRRNVRLTRNVPIG